MADIETFRNHIIESEVRVMDPEGVHHEFSAGGHGQKLDFDNIPTGSELYNEWVQTAADYIHEEYDELPDVILGVANGTNRVALDVARKFDGAVFGAVSGKSPENSKKLYLPKSTLRLIGGMVPKFVLVLEDVGTTGSNSVQVAEQARATGAKHVEVLDTWQRRPQLERLDEAGIAYRAIINEPLTTYSPEECRESGFCAQGWEFIPRK